MLTSPVILNGECGNGEPFPCGKKKPNQVSSKDNSSPSVPYPLLYLPYPPFPCKFLGAKKVTLLLIALCTRTTTVPSKKTRVRFRFCRVRYIFTFCFLHLFPTGQVKYRKRSVKNRKRQKIFLCHLVIRQINAACVIPERRPG